MDKIIPKTISELNIMAEGGSKLAYVKNKLKSAIRPGVSAYDIERLANVLIEESGVEASFKMVEGYKWATCVNVNSGLVHGIPKKSVVFKKGDVVSVDIGIFYQGFHTDTSFTVGIETDGETEKFLEAGRQALAKAIAQAKAGNRIFDISKEIEDTIAGAGYSPVKALVGHGVGRELHEDPQIPGFTLGTREESPAIPVGAALAIEVMYGKGDSDVVLMPDGWTISMADDKISALFEETVGVTENGPKVLTT